MGALDKKQKAYFKEPRRFADAWNGILFQGREVIRWDELEECDSVLTCEEGSGVERTADVIMKKTKDGRLLAMLMLENQKKQDYSLPARVFLEEALAYNGQVRAIKNRNKWMLRIEMDGGELMYQFLKEDRLRPVVMMVLYWNEEEWDGANSLEELIDFEGAEELREFVPRYPIRVIDVAKLRDPGRFRTDLRSVVEYFQRRNDKDAFREYYETCAEAYELNKQGIEVVSKLVGSAELSNLIKTKKSKGGNEKMCKAITELIEEGKEEGKREERANTEREKIRAEMAETRADEEKTRADEEKTRADVAERENELLRAEIERLKKAMEANPQNR